ncbi:MAG TPA: glycosyltransferase family 4 protein [Thermoleophilaceae bacterium]|nr:glycosyltransferase family 4 protein [Thermoleophilaceae bacterium]
MRVLFVTNMWPEEGRHWAGAFVKSQAESLRERGVTVDVFHVRGYRSQLEYLRGGMRALRWNAGLDYDVVHAHYGHTGVLARLQVRRPLVVSYCGDDLLGTPGADGSFTAKSRAEVAVFRQLARTVDATITKSRAMEAVLPPSCRARNQVIPNGVDTSYFAPQPREAARAELGWDPAERVVLFAGDPELPRKNFKLAKAAAERAANGNGGVHLRVAWNVDRERMRTMYAAADALLHTSLIEGSANVLKEAMAMELPVVAVPAGDAQERLEGVAGCAVCPYEAEPLAEAVARAVASGRSPQAREAVSALTAESVADRVVAVYESVLP